MSSGPRDLRPAGRSMMRLGCQLLLVALGLCVLIVLVILLYPR